MLLNILSLDSGHASDLGNKKYISGNKAKLYMYECTGFSTNNVLSLSRFWLLLKEGLVDVPQLVVLHNDGLFDVLRVGVDLLHAKRVL